MEARSASVAVLELKQLLFQIVCVGPRRAFLRIRLQMEEAAKGVQERG